MPLRREACPAGTTVTPQPLWRIASIQPGNAPRRCRNLFTHGRWLQYLNRAAVLQHPATKSFPENPRCQDCAPILLPDNAAARQTVTTGSTTSGWQATFTVISSPAYMNWMHFFIRPML